MLLYSTVAVVQLFNMTCAYRRGFRDDCGETDTAEVLGKYANATKTMLTAGTRPHYITYIIILYRGKCACVHGHSLVIVGVVDTYNILLL